MRKTNTIHAALFSICYLFIFFSCKNKSDGNKPSRQTVIIDTKREVAKDGNSGKLFDILTGQSTGIHFINDLPDNYQVNFWRYNYTYQGGGVCIGDINADGLQDIYFTGNISPNKLYLNKGNLKFEDITDKAGITKLPGEWTMSATMVDIDGDGDLDIYQCLGRVDDPEKRRNRLFINNGNTTFTDKSKESGIDDDTYSVMANFFDYDNDGDLDMYLATHPTDFADKFKTKALQKVEQHKNNSNHFYINNGNGSFTESHLKVGIDNHAYSLSGTVGDLNDDGYLDLYVANDFAMNDFVYMNDGKGKFIDASLKAISKTGINAMGSDIADINNDGLPDIFVTDMDMEQNYSYQTFQLSNQIEVMRVLYNAGYGYQNRSNSLQLNNGDGTFSEISRSAGISSTDWSWSTFLADMDNDGYKDVFVANGFVQDFHVDEMESYNKLRRAVRINDTTLYNQLLKELNKYTLNHPNFIFRNNGDLTFTDTRDDWGIYHHSISYAALYSDLDNDGDLDIVCNNANEEAFVYRNNADKMADKNNWLQFTFKGYAKNSAGLGTKVTVYYDSSKMQTAQHSNVRGYISTTENDVHFGMGKSKQADKVEIEWLDGYKQVLRNVACNQTLALDHANASTSTLFDIKPKPAPVFEKPADNLKVDFVQTENDYDDFLREYTLPHKMSCLGNGIAVNDVNNDGLDDVFIGAAMNQPSCILLQQKDGSYNKSAFAKDNMQYEDGGALLADIDGDGDNDLIVTTGGNELKENDKNYAVRLYTNDGKGNFKRNETALPGSNTISSSCVVAADYDKDGDLDIFIGGRQVPGKYLQPTSSFIYRNDKGKFTNVSNEVAPVLKDIGMVTSALWSDFNNDNAIDLVITGDWMPVTFLKNNNGKFDDVTNATGLEKNTGWWQSIASADVDSDGDMDYICGNFGTNKRFKSTVSVKDGTPLPLEGYLYDFDKSGTQDFIMGYYQNDVLYPVKSRERLIEQIPAIAKRIKTWDEFGKASLQDIFGSDLDKAIHKSVYNFRSSVLINDGGGKFSLKYLPGEVQISPMFGTVVDDFNEDGIPDILTHGNFYNTDMETTRYDASTGLLLLGKGNGEFTAVRSINSGFWSRGDCKSLAVSLSPAKKPVYFCGGSNMPIGTYQLTSNKSTFITLMPADATAIVTMNNGKTQKMEFCAGSGYLSQCAKFVRITPQIKQVQVLDAKGNSRTIYSAAVTASR